MVMCVDEIISIEQVSIDSQKYDITVKDNSNFFANGILVHNCQNTPIVFGCLGDVYITEKLDGTSFTAYFNDEVFGVCSRNLDLKETEDNSHWNLARKLELEEKLRSYGGNIAIQGEMIGSNIQGNLYKRNDHQLYVFNVYLIDERKYAPYDLVVSLAKSFDLNLVPLLHIGEAPFKNVEDALRYAEGRSSLHDVEREGVVVRTLDSEVSFKAISNKWLLKYE